MQHAKERAAAEASSSPTTAPARPPKDARTDEELMAAYKGGDAAAYRVLVERHHAPVYRFCLRALGGAKEAAADATQEVFLRVVKHAPTWEKKAKFTTWVYTIAKNHCIDEARKGRFRKTDSLNETVAQDGEGDEKIDRVAAETPSADRVAEGARLRKVVNEALAALPDEQREVFLLREHGGMAFKDIADVTGVNENTVKSRMRYALASLQKALQNAGFTRPDSS